MGKLLKKSGFTILTIFITLATIQLPVFAKDPVTVDADKAEAYTVGDDASGKVEAQMLDNFVQSNQSQPGLEMLNSKGSGTAYDDTIFHVEKLIDSRYLVFSNGADNVATRNRGAALYLVDSQGNILYQLLLDDGWAFGSTPWQENPAGKGNDYAVVVNKYMSNALLRIRVDGNLIQKLGIDSDFPTLDSLSGSRGSTINMGRGTELSDGVMLLTGQKNDSYINTADGITYLYTADITNGRYGALKIDDYDSVRTQGRNAYINMAGGDKLRSVQDGELVGVVSYTNLNGELQNAADSVNRIYHWGKGNIYQSRADMEADPMEILKSYEHPELGGDFKFLSISDPENLYFLEYCDNQGARSCPTKLKKWELHGDVITTLRTFPEGMVFDLILNQAGTGLPGSYLMYGYVPESNDGSSTYFGKNGLVWGSMSAGLTPMYVQSVSANGYTNVIYADVNSSGEVVFVGESSSTNLVKPQDMYGARGYPQENAATNKNTVVVRLKPTTDYAPGLNVGGPVIVNKDTVTDWDKALTEQVQVYDVNDAKNNWNSTDSKSRLNRNPNAPSNPIDWAGLGLDKTKVGAHYVKYFVTDSILNETADSKFISVIDAQTKIDDTNTIALHAEDFRIPLAEAKTLTHDGAKTKANLTSWDITDGTILDNWVTIDNNQLAAIQSADKTGWYPLIFTLDKHGKMVSKIVQVFVYDEHTDIDDTHQEAISAKNFDLDISEVEGLTQAAAITKAGAKAWSLITEMQVPVTADITGIQNKAGVYDATFRTAAGTSKTVKVTVKDANTEIGTTDAIRAENFQVSLDEVTAGLSDAVIIDKAHASAWSLADGTDVAVNIKSNGIQPAAGSYSVVFESANDKTTKTVMATVIDADTVVSDVDAIYARDFAVSLDEARALTDATIISKANAHAWKLSDGSPVGVTIKTNGIQVAAGGYTVVFVSENGTEISVTATVKDGNTDVDPEKGEAIYAEDFTIDTSEAAALTNAEIIAKAKAHAWSLTDGSPVNVSVKSNDIQTSAGAYNVVFATTAGTEITVTATVKDSDTNVDPEKGEAIYAQDFTVDSSEVAGLTNATIITKANVHAWSLTDGSVVAVNVKNSAIQATAGAYNVVFATTAGTEITVTATVKDGNTNVDPAKGEAIYAQDFTVDSSEVVGLTNAEIITKAKARAWSLADGNPVNVSVKSNGIQATAGAYDVTFATTAGTEITVTATVKDSDTNVDPEKGEAIYAQDFTIDVSEVAGLSDATIITKANAHAWKLSDGSPVVVSVKAHGILPGAGPYDVVFTTAAGTEITVTATVKDGNTNVDPAKGEAIYAEDFTVNLDEVARLSNTDIINKSGARAWNLNDGSAVIVSVKSNGIQATPGTYTVTFTTNNGVERTVRATVEDEDTVVGDMDAIYAKDFVVSLDEAATLSDAAIINKAQARAWKLADNSPVGVNVKNNGILAAAGSYNVVFNTENGTEITVTATVKDSDTNVDPDKGEAIYAQDFTVESSEVAGLTDATIINKAKVHAWNLNDGSSVAVSIKNNTIQVTAGAYTVTFKTANGTEITVTATVKDSNTDVEPEKGEAIYAEDFTVDASEVAALTNAEIIAKAKARAWSLADGNPVNVSVKSNDIQTSAGAYNVTFATTAGTEITVTATVKDGNTDVEPDKGEAIYAQDFTVDISEVSGLTDAAIINKANAHAWKLSDGSAVAVSVQVNGILPGAGAYNVTFATTAGTEITVTATVKDGNTDVEPDKGEAIYAEDFTVNVDEVAHLSNADIISKAGARAWRLNDGTAVTINVKSNGIQAIAGAYDVVFATIAGSEISVTATVEDDNTDVEPDKGEAIYAEDFTLDINEVVGLTNADIINKAGARAWKLSDGTPVTVSVKANAIEATAGAYNVVFATTAGTEIMVTATVKDSNTDVEPDKGEAIYAEDFTVDASEVATLTNTDIISKAKARAWSLADGSPVAVSVKANGILPGAGAYNVVLATTAGTEIIVTATVKDGNTDVEPDKGEAIYAEDFTVDASAVSGLSDADIINKAGARAWKLSDGTSVTVSVKTNAIEATAGAYDVTFATTAGTEITVTATVKDEDTNVEPDKGEAIYAQDFTIDVSEVAGLSDADIINKANAHAWMLSNGNDVTVLVKTNGINNQLGSYPVRFATAAGTEITIMVTVKDSNTVLTDEEAIAAKDFTVESNEVATLDEAALIAKASAQAWSLTDGSALSIHVTTNNIQVEAGAYEVTFATSKGTSVTVTATVKDEHTIISDLDAIRAQDFIVELDEVGTLDDAAIINRAGAQAWRLADGTVIPVSVKSNDIIEQIGSYSVTFATENGTEKTVRATVKDTDSNVEPVKGEAITAKDFTIESSEVASLDEAALILKAQARAWKLADGSDVAVSVKENHIQPQAGGYDVVFTTAAGTEIRVTASVIDSNTNVDPQSGEAIYAEDFQLSSSEAETADDAALIEKAKAKAWKLADGSDVAVQVVENNIVAAPGSYSVKFATADGTAITVTASITNEDAIVDPVADTALYAHGFELAIDAVPAFDEAQAIMLAEAKAWKLSDGSEIPFSTDISAVQQQVGAYPIVFMTETGVSITVYASVIDERVTIEDGIALSANDFTAPLSDYQTKNAERAKARANVKAWDTRTGEDLTSEVTVDYYNQIEALIYQVNFKIERSIQQEHASVFSLFSDITLRADQEITVTLYEDGSELPATGQDNNLWMLAGMILVSASLGIFGSRRKVRK